MQWLRILFGLLQVSLNHRVVAIKPEAGVVDAYDRKCDEIVMHSSLAGQLFNAGRKEEAIAKLEAAEASFRAAKKLRPTEPQAFVSIATTMLNAQRFDESIQYWQEAAKLLPKGRAQDWATSRATWAQYGKVSTERDRIYAHGQGNVTQALELMQRQLDIYPAFPTLHHDKATALVMLSALREKSVGEALLEFSEAQESTFRAWRAGLRATGASKCCAECGGVVLDWPGHFSAGHGGALTAVDWVSHPADGQPYGGHFLDGRAFIARFEGKAGSSSVAVAGGDGIIVDELGCWLFLSSSSRWAQGPRNLQMLELWSGPPSPQDADPPLAFHDHGRGQFPNGGRTMKVRTERKVASVVQFAAASFFHFVSEVLGRLLILRRGGILDDTEVMVVLPKVAGMGSKAAAKGATERKGFAGEALDMLAGDIIAANRAIWLRTDGPPDVRLRMQTLFFADWLPPAEPGSDGSHCAAPRSVLQLTRSALLEAVDGTGLGQSKDSRNLLIFISRAGQSMRGTLKNEAGLEAGLRSLAKSTRPSLEFVRFASEPRSLHEQVSLFRRARVVIGVHGGALTNLMFATAGTKVFEVGFESPFAGHYRHVAAAMDLVLTLLPLSADARGMGADRVELAGDGVTGALAVVQSVLSTKSQPDQTPSSEL